MFFFFRCEIKGISWNVLFDVHFIYTQYIHVFSPLTVSSQLCASKHQIFPKVFFFAKQSEDWNGCEGRDQTRLLGENWWILDWASLRNLNICPFLMFPSGLGRKKALGFDLAWDSSLKYILYIYIWKKEINTACLKVLKEHQRTWITVSSNLKHRTNLVRNEKVFLFSLTEKYHVRRTVVFSS